MTSQLSMAKTQLSRLSNGTSKQDATIISVVSLVLLSGRHLMGLCVIGHMNEIAQTQCTC